MWLREHVGLATQSSVVTVVSGHFDSVCMSFKIGK